MESQSIPQHHQSFQHKKVTKSSTQNKQSFAQICWTLEIIQGSNTIYSFLHSKFTNSRVLHKVTKWMEEDTPYSNRKNKGTFIYNQSTRKNTRGIKYDCHLVQYICHCLHTENTDIQHNALSVRLLVFFWLSVY